jgi:hypothetical protein
MAPSRRTQRAPRAYGRLLALFLLVPAQLASAEGAGSWRRISFECSSGPASCAEPGCCGTGILVEARQGEDARESRVYEVRATGEIDAAIAEVFAVVTAYEKQRGVAHIEDVRILRRGKDEVILWALARMPIISPRDWVVCARVFPALPGGAMQVAWRTCDVPEAPPPRPGVVRVPRNVGAWTLVPIDGGRRTRARCEMSVDPGGLIPAWVAYLAMRSELPGAFKIVRREAERRARASEAPGRAVEGPGRASEGRGR